MLNYSVAELRIKMPVKCASALCLIKVKILVFFFSFSGFKDNGNLKRLYGLTLKNIKKQEIR